MAVVQGMVDWKKRPIDKDIHGGNRVARFIYFLELVTSITFVATIFNIITYFLQTMHMDVAMATTTVTNIMGTSCAFALGFGLLLALQAHFPSLQPPPCDMSAISSSCKQVTGYRAAILHIGLYLYTFGEGCLRANLVSLGGDQFDDDDPKELKQNLTLLVWIQDKKGWDLAFTVSAGFILVGVVVIASGFSFFRNIIPTGSPLTRMLQVPVASYRKRNLQFPENDEEIYLEYNKEENVGEVLPRTKGLKWLDRASISDGNAGNWHLCSVSQVEGMKIVLRMLPVFFSSMIGYISLPLLLTLTIQQGVTMNTKLGAIHVPPASLFLIPVAFQLVILVLYDRLMVPFARKITGCPTGITHLQRAGVGFVANIIATVIGAVIKKKRKGVAEEYRLLDSGKPVPMHVMWLGLQFFAVGIVDISTFVGLLEFFNNEVSKGMKSLGTAIFWCNIGMSSFMGTVLVNVVNKATRNRGIGWLEGNNLNRNYLDRFYWLLAILGSVTFINYLYWARRYTYRQRSLASIS
ncbi:hypothetical protein C5167_025313 [Papaver somniferum]|uniref:Uncharacterized protein n=1 Tax=Papaver somniferum TaxID=3469 RepID=A0A4Y7JUD5_PAPSO|nr:hypothetical protein C5167_025313 [Papaver somniferum]